MNMPLNIDWQQILLHLFNFVILFGILYFLLYNPVKKFMDKRVEYYKNLDDEAKENLKQSENAKEEYRHKLEKANQEIASKKEEAHQELKEIYASKVKEAEAEAEKIISDARKSGERERAKLLNEAQQEMADMVVRAAEKLATESTTSDTYDLFLDSVKGSDKNE